MNFAIVGLGAIGTVFATFLKSAGHKVYAFVKPYQKDALRGKELKVSGVFGERTSRLDNFFSDPIELKGLNIDCVIIAVKSFDTETVVKTLQPFINEQAVFISAQNGYGNFETISEYVGENRTLLARVIFGSKIVTSGEAIVTVVADDVRLGSPNRKIKEDKVKQLADVFRKAGIPTSVSDNIVAVLWDKILYNCALNPLGAILECNYGKLAEMSWTREIMSSIIDEIFTVTALHEIRLNWKDAAEYKSYFYNHLLPPTKEHFPSMYYDIIQGKKTEIDALCGAVVKLGKLKGAETPVNETITNLIYSKEKIKGYR